VANTLKSWFCNMSNYRVFTLAINTRRKTPIFDWFLQLNFSCKRQGVLDERKSQQIQVHLLTTLYMYCHMWLRCNYFGHHWGQMMCCHVSQYIINNNNHSINIEIICDVQFTCLDDLNYDTWTNVNLPRGSIN
jgi:hypothetical protein